VQRGVEHRGQWPAALAQRGEGDAEKHAEEHDLQDVALGEGLHGAGRHDVGEELGERERFALRGVARGVTGGDVGGGQARAGTGHVHNDEPDGERERGYDLEIEERLPAHAADLLEVGDVRDAEDDGEEDDRTDHHLHELHERVAHRAQGAAQLRVERPQQGAQRHRAQDLESEVLGDALHAGRSTSIRPRHGACNVRSSQDLRKGTVR
jgi:hypothetical protein